MLSCSACPQAAFIAARVHKLAHALKGNENEHCNTCGVEGQHRRNGLGQLLLCSQRFKRANAMVKPGPKAAMRWRPDAPAAIVHEGRIGRWGTTCFRSWPAPASCAR